MHEAYMYCAFRQRFSICCFKVNFLSIVIPSSKASSLASTLTLFRMGIFGAAHGWEWRVKSFPIPKICHIYPTMMKLGRVIRYLKKIQKIYESRDAHPEFC